MGDVSVPRGLKVGDLVTASSSQEITGIIIRIGDFSDPHSGIEFVAEVLWADGKIDNISVDCLYRAND